MQSTVPETSVYLLPPDQVIEKPSSHATACFEELRTGFAIQATTSHTLVADPNLATVILAPIQGAGYGHCFEALRSSRTYREHANKLVVYSPDSNQFPALRGLYPAVPRRWFRRGWALPAHYISTHIHKFTFMPDATRNKDILFSFVGSSRTAPVRAKVVRLQHPNGVIFDSSPKGDQEYWWEKADKAKFLELFKHITQRSKFVVCPRGINSSSIRLFEAMEAACVPVIVSDGLELPLGPKWEDFSVRVPERNVHDIPGLAERLRDQASSMGAIARRTWEDYFSPQATVGTVVGWSRLLLAQPCRRPALLQVEEYTTPRLIRSKLR